MKAPPVHTAHPEQGMALVGMAMVVGSLALVAGTAYVVVNNNVSITGQSRMHQESFFQADAGIHYVQAQLIMDVSNGTINLDQDTISPMYTAPNGYTFDTFTNVTRLANGAHYLIEITGRSQGSVTRIEAVLGRDSSLGDIGVFGDRSLLIQPGFDIYSYNSNEITNPSPSDSTGEAGVGSNESVSVQPGASIDGTIYLGVSAGGTLATVSGAGSIPVSEVSRVEPDPLGAVGGALADSFAHYSVAANNDNVAGAIVGNSLNVGNHDSYTLYPGVYYLDSLTLGSHSDLHIESTPDNPAVIFLTGELRCQPSTEFFSTDRSPRSLYIFSTSTGEFRIQPNSEFRGFVYAPYAELRIQPGGDAYGVFWASTVRLQPNGDLYVDNRALEDFLSNALEIVQWKEVR